MSWDEYVKGSAICRTSHLTGPDVDRTRFGFAPFTLGLCRD